MKKKFGMFLWFMCTAVYCFAVYPPRQAGVKTHTQRVLEGIWEGLQAVGDFIMHWGANAGR